MGFRQQKDSLLRSWDKSTHHIGKDERVRKDRKTFKLRLAIRTTLARPTRDVQAAAAEGRQPNPAGPRSVGTPPSALGTQSDQVDVEAVKTKRTPRQLGVHRSLTRPARRGAKNQRKKKKFPQFTNFQKIFWKSSLRGRAERKGGRLKLRRPLFEFRCKATPPEVNMFHHVSPGVHAYRLRLQRGETCI